MALSKWVGVNKESGYPWAVRLKRVRAVCKVGFLGMAEPVEVCLVNGLYRYLDRRVCAALYGTERRARDMLFREYLDRPCAWDQLCAWVSGCRGWRGSTCVCGYLGVRCVDAIAGANRQVWRLLCVVRVQAKLDWIGRRAVTFARRDANCVWEMVASPMW